jgi:predicted RecB family endonuclease
MTDDEMKTLLATMSEENRRYFDATAESLRHDIQTVAEVAIATREALDRHRVELREEIRRSAAETQAMIKFSHSDLDRRVQSLEEAKSKHDDAIARLEARVERIESTTH